MPLIFVPTPLGNLRDVTLRAIDVLNAAELIVAEDTRVARKLLNALGIPSREIWSYREQNADRVTSQILERAREAAVAVTSDAGMPGISDPGSALVAAAHAAGVSVEVLPGANAATSVALLSGFPLDRFTFEGFPPRSAGARRGRFTIALRGGATTIWYESPHRIGAALRDLDAVAPDAGVFLVREYTKLHEQQLWGTASSVAAALTDPVRGEIAFAVGPYRAASAERSTLEGRAAAIDELLAQGCGVADIARRLSASGMGARRELYAEAASRKAARKTPIKQP